MIDINHHKQAHSASAVLDCKPLLSWMFQIILIPFRLKLHLKKPFFPSSLHLKKNFPSWIMLIIFFFLFLFLSKTAPEAYRSSQARGWIWATSATYATACGNARSLTYWARPRIEPTFWLTLCQVINPLNHNGNSFSPFFKVLLKPTSPIQASLITDTLWTLPSSQL